MTNVNIKQHWQGKEGFTFLYMLDDPLFAHSLDLLLSLVGHWIKRDSSL